MRKLFMLLALTLMVGGAYIFSPRTYADTHVASTIYLPLAHAAPAPLNDYVGLFNIGPLNEYDLYTARPDGSDLQRLTTDMGTTSPLWSPDYAQILFISIQETATDLWLMNSDGTEQRNLTENFGTPYQHTWSPDGSRLSFVSKENENEQLTVIDPTLPVPQWTLAFPEIESLWAPDGSYLGLTVLYTEAGDSHISIYTVNADGSGVTRITDPADDYILRGWMRDGSRMLVQRLDRDTTTVDLLLINPDGSAPEIIYPDAEPMYNITIAPDGERFAYITEVDKADQVKTFALSNPTPVAVSPVYCTEATCQIYNIQWSPASDWLTYAMSTQACPNCFYSSVYSTPADGSAIPPLNEPLYGDATIGRWLDRTRVSAQYYLGNTGTFNPYIVDPYTKAIIAEVLPEIESRVFVHQWHYDPQ